MTARTSSGSGLFSAVVGTCVNGDTFTIQAGHNVTLDVDLSTLTTGLGASTINGVLDCKADVATGLFMNANLDVNGALYIANRAVLSGFTLTEGKSNVYEIARTLLVATVEETLGYGYKNAEDELTDLAVSIENYRLHTLYQPEMMADVVKEFRITYRNSLTLADALNYVEENPDTFYHDTTNNKLYIHTSDNSNPSSKTITVIEPINRPTSGTESRCNLKFNSSGVISNTGGGNPIIRMYGWYPSREFTQLNADAALNATTIVLNHDMGFQAGDKILITSGTERGAMAESNKGVYSVQSYDSGTKTVTLTSGLQTARLNGDYVAWCSRPIKISRASGNVALVKTNISGVIQGVYSGGFYIIRPDAGYIENIIRNWTFNHFTSNFWTVVWSDNITLTNGLIYGASAGISTISDSIIKNIIFSGMSYPLLNMAAPIENCIIQNVNIGVGSKGCPVLVKNSVMKNIVHITDSDDTIFKNCDFSGHDAIEVNCLYHAKFIDCVFREAVDADGWLGNMWGELDNCLFEGTENVKYQAVDRPPYLVLESFDHNQTTGNYKAWMRGGKIETENNKLKFICESADYPVFRDYPILAPANRTIKFLIGLTKDTPGITTKLQIIDPANDPLIDSTATPLAESIATNNTSNQQIGVAYKSTTPKQLILRILCQNASGNVIIDTTRIDQSLAKRIS